MNTEWNLQPGDRIRRVDLHERFGGRPRGGISPSRGSPNVMIFTDRRTGEQHGYLDHWEGDVFLYTGEGQTNDQTMNQGNAAILNHAKEGRALRVFKGTGGIVLYLGEFVLAEPPWIPSTAPETGGGPIRKVIVFRLVPVEHSSDAQALEEKPEYRHADEDVKSKAADPFERDPNAVDRALAAHARLQNSLHAFLKQHRVTSWSSQQGEPDYDLAWRRRKELYVAEVKSLPAGSETKQLRLGLGQVLDYQDTLLERHSRVRPVLVVERRPADPRWVRLCERLGVGLVWPKSFEELLS